MEYGILFAQSSHFFPNRFLSAISSFDILDSKKKEVVMLHTPGPKYITTSNFPDIVFHNPDSMIQDFSLRFQGNHP